MAIMFVTLFCASLVMIVRANLMLFPFITYKEIQGNSKYINATIAEVGAHDHNKTYLIEFKAVRDIRDLKIFISYATRAMDGAIQNTLFSRWIGWCTFLGRPSSDRLIKIGYDAIKNYSKIPRCPYLVGNTVMLNITPSSFPVPGIIPKTDFLLEAKAYTNARKVVLFESRWYGGIANM